MTALALITQLASTLILTGLIWTIQLVHYPLLANVAPSDFESYHREHMRRITRLVVPLMLLEAASALVLVVRPPEGPPAWAPWAGLALVATVWLSTALLQVPQHTRLSRGFDAPAHARLLAGNWVRTSAWTARSGLVIWMTLLETAARQPA